MSLKAFHIVFIAISTMLCLGFGYYLVRSYRTSNDTGALVVAIISFASAFTLLIYGRWFLRKLKGYSYL